MCFLRDGAGMASIPKAGVWVRVAGQFRTEATIGRWGWMWPVAETKGASIHGIDYENGAVVASR